MRLKGRKGRPSYSRQGIGTQIGFVRSNSPGKEESLERR